MFCCTAALEWLCDLHLSYWVGGRSDFTTWYKKEEGQKLAVFKQRDLSWLEDYWYAKYYCQAFMSTLLINCTAQPFLHAVNSFTEQALQLLMLPNVHYLLRELSNKTRLSDIVSIIMTVGGATTIILLHIKYLTMLPYLFNISWCAMISSQNMCSQLKKVWMNHKK